jgi:hypothetical protein
MWKTQKGPPAKFKRDHGIRKQAKTRPPVLAGATNPLLRGRRHDGRQPPGTVRFDPNLGHQKILWLSCLAGRRHEEHDWHHQPRHPRGDGVHLDVIVVGVEMQRSPVECLEPLEQRFAAPDRRASRYKQRSRRVGKYFRKTGDVVRILDFNKVSVSGSDLVCWVGQHRTGGQKKEDHSDGGGLESGFHDVLPTICPHQTIAPNQNSRNLQKGPARHFKRDQPVWKGASTPVLSDRLAGGGEGDVGVLVALYGNVCACREKGGFMAGPIRHVVGRGRSEHGKNRLVMPAVAIRETAPVDQSTDKNGGGGGGDDGLDKLGLDPLLIALLKKIPTSGQWPAAQRVRWFRTFAMNVSQIYDGDSNPVEMKIDLDKEAAN